MNEHRYFNRQWFSGDKVTKEKITEALGYVPADE